MENQGKSGKIRGNDGKIMEHVASGNDEKNIY